MFVICDIGDWKKWEGAFIKFNLPENCRWRCVTFLLERGCTLVGNAYKLKVRLNLTNLGNLVVYKTQ